MAIARPESTSASASAIRNRVVDAVLAVQDRVAAVRAKVTARPSTGSPRSRPASCQSATAAKLEIASPMPERRIAGSERRT